jgi:signal transduction histidine kinase
MNPLRSVGGKLALALLVLVTGALAIVYVIVVPSYERAVVDARLDSLQDALRTIAAARPPGAPLDQDWVKGVATPIAPDARVVVFRFPRVSRIAQPLYDSETSDTGDVVNDPIALLTARRQRLTRGTTTRDGQRFAEVAQPVGPGGRVLLLSTRLQNELETVGVVRRRVLLAGGLAIAFAMLLGYALAAHFARRIGRVERSVERIAAGRFDETVADSSRDELGQLATAIDRMRLRLSTLDRARGEFIANASHELRTPLFSLAGFLELLTSEVLDEETRAEFLEEMRQQVSRLTKLATDLLDLSRIDAGRLSVAAEELDLAQLGEELVAEFGPRAAATEHVLEDDFHGTVPALGDAVRVLQIGRILVANALVHTPRGTVVRLSAAIVGDRATLAVEDDGPGIPVAAQTQVFDRFYRLEGGVASGSGIGLAIAHDLAELMGGRIELVSGDGRTRFTIVLPARSATKHVKTPAGRSLYDR